MSDVVKLVSSVVLALGIAVGGFFPGYYYYKSRMESNFVTVKGLAEMDVRADLGVWDIKYVVTGNDLATAQAEMEAQQKIILSFLKNLGFEYQTKSNLKCFIKLQYHLLHTNYIFYHYL